MNIKTVLLKKKRLIISCIACFLIAGVITIIGNTSDKEISALQFKNSDIISQIAKKDEILKADKAILETSKKNLSEYENKKDSIDKAKSDKLEKEKEEKAKLDKETERKALKPNEEQGTRKENYSNSKSSSKKPSNNTSDLNNKPIGTMVWRTRTGKKYHSTNHCGKTNSATAIEITLKEAEAEGLTACSKCF